MLKNAKEMGGDEVVTKSGLMVGLGETHEEMVETFGILREHHVQVLTVGQYLRPTERHLPIVRYWHPDEFKALEEAAYALGFDHIAAGPLVRSSYHADQHVPQDQPGRRAARGVGRHARWTSRTAIRTRRTHKVYGAEPVDRATLDELLELATLGAEPPPHEPVALPRARPARRSPR